jgi:mono/diheme cytochrome c family protein
MKNNFKDKIIFISAVLILKAGCLPVFSQAPPPEWKAPALADTIKNPIPFTGDNILKGKKIFVQTCIPCHGDKGKGDGLASVALNPKPANLISAKVQAQKDGAIFWKLSSGRNAMASYAPLLSTEQKWLLINYIRFIGKMENKK